MYYIMSEEGSHILEIQSNRPTAKELQETANFMGCAVYVIQGEHAGMSAAPDNDSDIDNKDIGSVIQLFHPDGCQCDICDNRDDEDMQAAEQHDFWQIKAGLCN